MSGVNNNYLNPLKLYRMPQNGLQQVVQTIVSAQVNVPVPTAAGQVSKGPYTLADLKETGLTDELIKKYFEVNEDGKYVLKQDSGYSSVEELLYTYHQTFANSQNSIATSTSMRVSAAPLRSDNNTEETTAEQYIAELKGISKKDGQKAAVDKFIQDFIRGNVTWNQVLTILEALGMKGAKIDETKRDGSYCVTFTFEGKNYELYCNKKAAASGSDDVQNKILNFEEVNDVKSQLKDKIYKELGIDTQDLKNLNIVLNGLKDQNVDIGYSNCYILLNKMMQNLQKSSVLKSLFTSEQIELLNQWNKEISLNDSDYFNKTIDFWIENSEALAEIGKIVQSLFNDINTNLFEGVVFKDFSSAYALNTELNNYDFFAKLLEEMYPEEPKPSVPETNGGNNGGGSGTPGVDGTGEGGGTGKPDGTNTPGSVSGSGNDKTLSIEERAEKHMNEILELLNDLDKIRAGLKNIGYTTDVNDGTLADIALNLYGQYLSKTNEEILKIDESNIVMQIRRILINPNAAGEQQTLEGVDNVKAYLTNVAQIKEDLKKYGFDEQIDNMSIIALSLLNKYSAMSSEELANIDLEDILYDVMTEYNRLKNPTDEVKPDGEVGLGEEDDDLAAKLEAKFNEIQTYLNNPDLKNKLAKEGMEDNRFESIKAYLENYYQGLKNDESLLDINDVEAFILKAFRDTNENVDLAIGNITAYLYTDTEDFYKALQEKGIENDTAAVNAVRDALLEYYSNLSVEELLNLGNADWKKDVFAKFMNDYEKYPDAPFISYEKLCTYLNTEALELKAQIEEAIEPEELTDDDYTEIAEDMKSKYRTEFNKITKADLLQAMIAKAKELKEIDKSDDTTQKDAATKIFNALTIDKLNDETKFQTLSWKGAGDEAIAQMFIDVLKDANLEEALEAIGEEKFKNLVRNACNNCDGDLAKYLKGELPFHDLMNKILTEVKNAIKEEFQISTNSRFDYNGGTFGRVDTNGQNFIDSVVDFSSNGFVALNSGFLTHEALCNYLDKHKDEIIERIKKDIGIELSETDYSKIADEVKDAYRKGYRSTTPEKLIQEMITKAVELKENDKSGDFADLAALEAYIKGDTARQIIADKLERYIKKDEYDAIVEVILKDFDDAKAKETTEQEIIDLFIKAYKTHRSGEYSPKSFESYNALYNYTHNNQNTYNKVRDVIGEYVYDANLYTLANKITSRYNDDEKAKKLTEMQALCEFIIYALQKDIEADLGNNIDDETFAAITQKIAAKHRDDFDVATKAQLIAEVILYLERTNIQAATGTIDDATFADIAKEIAAKHRGDDVNKIDKNLVITQFIEEYQKNPAIKILDALTTAKLDEDKFKELLQKNNNDMSNAIVQMFLDVIKEAKLEKELEAFGEDKFKDLVKNMYNEYINTYQAPSLSDLISNVLVKVKNAISEYIKTGSMPSSESKPVKGDFADYDDPYSAMEQYLYGDDAGHILYDVFGFEVDEQDLEHMVPGVIAAHKDAGDYYTVTEEQLINEFLALYNDNYKTSYEYKPTPAGTNTKTYPSGYKDWDDCWNNGILKGDIYDGVKENIKPAVRMRQYYSLAIDALKPELERDFATLSKEMIIHKITTKIDELSTPNPGNGKGGPVQPSLFVDWTLQPRIDENLL